MVDGFYFKNSELYGKIKIENENKSIILDALVDTGAFKTLIPETACKNLNLILVETKHVWGICPTPIKVNIYLAKVYFLDNLVINSIIGFDIPSQKQVSLIGRDILSQFDINILNSTKICELNKL